jgi:hypothetical protein
MKEFKVVRNCEFIMVAIVMILAAIFFNWKLSIILFLTIFASNISSSRIRLQEKLRYKIWPFSGFKK